MYQFPKNWYLYSVEYSMNSTYLSSYLNLLWVLSLELCSFHNTSPEHVSLELCLIILFCWVIISGVLFLTVVSTCSFLVYRNTTDFLFLLVAPSVACGILVPWPRIEFWTQALNVKSWSLDCQGVPLTHLFQHFFLSGFLGIFFIDNQGLSMWSMCLCNLEIGTVLFLLFSYECFLFSYLIALVRTLILRLVIVESFTCSQS